jgi:class 3 adenylate cyclase
VTFLFTDIEGSSRRWEDDPDGVRLAVARHDDMARGAIEGNRGRGRGDPGGLAELASLEVWAGS